MVGFCLNRLEHVRTVMMEDTQRTGYGWAAYVLICLWCFCSAIQLILALYRWLFAPQRSDERSYAKCPIYLLLVLSTLLVVIAGYTRWIPIYVHKLMAITLGANLAQIYLLLTVVNMAAEKLEELDLASGRLKTGASILGLL
jgi:hypothetical protein